MKKKIKANPWIVNVISSYDSPKTLAKEYGGDEEDYGPEASIEVSIVRSNNKHGQQSYGWDGDDKVIIYDEIVESKKDFDKAVSRWTKRANVMCEALNKEEQSK